MSPPETQISRGVNAVPNRRSRANAPEPTSPRGSGAPPSKLRRYKDTPEHVSWRLARSRCQNPNCRSFKRYGGRGIQMDPRWDDFQTFLADMGPRPIGGTLDRINSDGPYAPENCRWASMKVQQRNRGNNRLFEFRGERLTLAEIAERFGLTRSALFGRVVKRGMTIEQAISLPLVARKGKPRST